MKKKKSSPVKVSKLGKVSKLIADAVNESEIASEKFDPVSSNSLRHHRKSKSDTKSFRSKLRGDKSKSIEAKSRAESKDSKDKDAIKEIKVKENVVEPLEIIPHKKASKQINKEDSLEQLARKESLKKIA